MLNWNHVSHFNEIFLAIVSYDHLWEIFRTNHFYKQCEQTQLKNLIKQKLCNSNFARNHVDDKHADPNFSKRIVSPSMRNLLLQFFKQCEQTQLKHLVKHKLCNWNCCRNHVDDNHADINFSDRTVSPSIKLYHFYTHC